MAIAPTAENTTTVEVHRCRFVDWKPSAITAIAFSPLAPPDSKPGPNARSSKRGILAVGRANGTIEICEWAAADWRPLVPQGWVVRRVFAAPYPSKVESLAFALKDPGSLPAGSAATLADLRLFTTTGGKDLLEWDITSGTVMTVLDSEGGSIWSMAVNPMSTTLAIGCEDGTIRLLSLEDNSITPIKRLDRAKTRILSLAWGVPAFIPKPARSSEDSDSDDDEDDRWMDKTIIAGCSDSSIRKWDISTGRIVERMTTDKVRNEKTLVWAVGVLSDGTIVSGDSLGTVKFWDPMTFTQLHSFQGHGADVLCLAVGYDNKSVYTSGVDQRISEFALVQVTNAEAKSGSSRWVHIRSRRIHTHDVRALAIWPPAQIFPKVARHNPGTSAPANTTAMVIASGGLDMAVVFTPCFPPSMSTAFNPLFHGPATSFEDAYYQRTTFGQLTAGGNQVLQLAKSARYLMCRRDTAISLWYIRPKEEPDVSSRHSGEQGWDKILDMELKTETTLVCSAISDDGKWLAISDAYETKLFRLQNQTEDGIKLHATKIRTFNDILRSSIPSTSASILPRTSASAMLFTPDSKKLILGVTSLVLIVDLPSTTDNSESAQASPKVLRCFSQHRMSNGAADGRTDGRVIKPLPGTSKAPEAESDDGDEGSEDEIDAEMPDDNTSADVLKESSWPPITHFACSLDGQWLASSDLRGRTNVFNVDAVQHHCSLPTSPLAPTALAFNPSSPQTLLLGFPNNTIQVFDVETRKFPDWFRQVASEVQRALGSLRDSLVGLVFDPSLLTPAEGGTTRKSVVLWGANWMCKVYLGDGKPRSAPSKQNQQRWKKRKQTAGSTVEVGVRPEEWLTPVRRYHEMLMVEFIGPGEMVVVERPLIDILQTLPPAYFKPRYGSG